MSRLFLRSVTTILLVCMLSGCATMSDSTKTKAQGAGLGAVILGGLGAIGGALIGGNKGAIIGAAAGVAVGGAVGCWWGSTVAERKKKYVNDEQMLDEEINVVAVYNNKLREDNGQKEIQIAQMKHEVAELNARYRKGNIKLSALQAKKKEIDTVYCEGQECKNHMNKELKALSTYQKSINGTKDPQKVAKLNREIAALKQNIAMLDTNNRQLAKLQNSLAGVRK